MKLQFTKEEKRFLGKWVLANGISWPIGIILAIALSYAIVNIFYPEETNLIVGICLGAAVGYAQWLVMKRYIRISVWWIFASAIGIGLPFVIGVILYELLGTEIRISGIEIVDQAIAIFLGGFITGFLQYRLFQSLTPRYKLWIIICTLAWGLSWFSLIFGGVLLGLIMGIIFLRLFEFPVNQNPKAEN